MDIEWRAVSSMHYYCGLKEQQESYNIVTAYNDSLCDILSYPSDLMK